MKASEIKKEAREGLKGKWKKAIFIVLGFEIISFLITMIQSFVPSETIVSIIDLAYFILSIPLSFGLIISFMKLLRGEEVFAFSFLMEGLSRFKKAWGITLYVLLKLWLPLICLIICSFFILSFLITTFGTIASYLFVAFCIFSIVYMIIQSLLYVLAYNISYDNPELSSKECVLKSAELMKGNRKRYFFLGLSFIGWVLLICFVFLLCIMFFLPYISTISGYISWYVSYTLTTFCSMILFIPYVQSSFICFYNNLVKAKKEKIEEITNNEK